MEPKILPLTSSCHPLGNRLGERLGPYHGFARPDAPGRPLFSSEEAERIAEAWRALPPPAAGGSYDAHHNATRGVFRFYDPKADEWHEWAGEEAGVATLYPIGEGMWKWDCGS